MTKDGDDPELSVDQEFTEEALSINRFGALRAYDIAYEVQADTIGSSR